MIGKLAGAWLGNRMAGRHTGATGAILGYGAAAAARRGLGPLAAVAAVGWGVSKLMERRRSRATYPASATPSSPAG